MMMIRSAEEDYYDDYDDGDAKKQMMMINISPCYFHAMPTQQIQSQNWQISKHVRL